MEAQSSIKIVLFSESEESNSSDGSIQAQFDKTMPVSIVSKGMLNKMKSKYVPCQKEPVKDSKNVIYSPVGQVDLRWHKEEQGKSYAETFYVVDQQTPLVILGSSAFEKSNKSAGGTIYPVGVQQQTADPRRCIDPADVSSLNTEENAILERKRQEVAARNAKETQEQEEIEAERRKQAKPSK
ncbi:MAG: hypothetical protein LQ338_002633 [Usnochroma carphineum]|nr:MAG: hypothetical protein LQ338_002633 [Usnochroma carphineum]